MYRLIQDEEWSGTLFEKLREIKKEQEKMREKIDLTCKEDLKNILFCGSCSNPNKRHNIMQIYIFCTTCKKVNIHYY